MYIDTHCHLDFEEFDQDRDQIWQACKKKGIKHLLIPSVSPDNYENLAQLCTNNNAWKFAVGMHPWWLDKVKVEINGSHLSELIIPFLKHSSCTAIGECGLDSMIATPIDRQLEILEVQVRLAERYRKPLIIHCVKSHNDLIALLKRHKPHAGGVIHGFSGSLNQAEAYWGLGFYIGIGGTITYDRAKKTRDAISAMPLESLLLETDAPAMPLSGQQGKRNSPLQVIKIAEVLAELKGETVINIARKTSCNAINLFNF